jgi:signal transduction histidine kinase
MMLQAVAHDVKNKLSELALCLAEENPAAAALALDAAQTLTQGLMIDNQNLEPQIDAACSADLLDELSILYQPLFRGKNIKVDIVGTPVLWFYDCSLMRLALSNAVHNALKFCRSTVWLSVHEKDGFLVFEVRDDGAGFPEEFLHTDFSSVNSVASQSNHGTGLGLMLSSRIMHLHATARDGVTRTGRVELLNDGGAVVRLALP